ncbi:hypothetical protein B0H13DRAFT_1909475 [Mycena leptocephala]|nr:hypothetical protein B0H13DRAFT_1909475 [Mycena leptocephala]
MKGTASSGETPFLFAQPRAAEKLLGPFIPSIGKPKRNTKRCSLEQKRRGARQRGGLEQGLKQGSSGDESTNDASNDETQRSNSNASRNDALNVRLDRGRTQAATAPPPRQQHVQCARPRRRAANRRRGVLSLLALVGLELELELLSSPPPSPPQTQREGKKRTQWPSSTNRAQSPRRARYAREHGGYGRLLVVPVPVRIAIPIPGVVLVIIIIIILAVPRPSSSYSGLPSPVPIPVPMPMPAMRTRHRRNIAQRPNAHAAHTAARPAASPCAATRSRTPRADPPDARRTHDSGSGSLAGPPPRERPPEVLVVLLLSDIVLGERNKKKERESRQASQRDASPVETEGGSHGGTATTVERSFNLPLRKALYWASKLTPLKILTINSECPPFQFL